MIYAYLTDGIDAEHKQQLDDILASADNSQKAQARREREAMARLMSGPRRR